MYRGESFTLGLLFSGSYDTSRIEELQLSFGTKLLGSLTQGTITLEEGGIYRCELSSEDTLTLSTGLLPITLHVEDQTRGVIKKPIGSLSTLSSLNKTATQDINQGYNQVITLTLEESQIEETSFMGEFIKGDSAWKVWERQEGNYGKTEQEYLEWVQSPANQAASASYLATTSSLQATSESIYRTGLSIQATEQSIQATSGSLYQTSQSVAATELSLEVSSHPPLVQEDYWWSWNTVTKVYENTGIRATGDVEYTTFYLDPLTGTLSMIKDEDFQNTSFSINSSGQLQLIINS